MRALIFAETDNMRDVGLARQLAKQLRTRIVAVEDRIAARLDAFENLGLGAGDLVEVAELAEMSFRNQRNDRDMWPHELRERADFARIVHADFEYRVVAFPRRARQTQRHAPVIIERLGGGMHLADGRQGMTQRLLGAGLAGRAGDRDDLGIRPRASGSP
jgi:hypothetical protein